MDIFIRSTAENASRIIQTLKDFGFGKLDVTKDDFLEDNQVIQLGYPPNRIDLLTSISGVEFDDAWKNQLTNL